MGCNPLTHQTAGIYDPPHDFTEGLACSLVAKQLVKVSQVFRKWGLPRYLLYRNRMPPENSLPSLYHLDL